MKLVEFENKNLSIMNKEELEHYMRSILKEMNEILDIADKRKDDKHPFFLIAFSKSIPCYIKTIDNKPP